MAGAEYMTNMTDEVSTSFKSISHPIRVQILLILADQLNNGSQFSELSRELRIESSGKLSFHLEKLDNLVSQDEQGRYHLNDKGLKAVEAIKILGVRGKDNDMDRPEVSSMGETTDLDSQQSNDITVQSYLGYIITFVMVQLVFGLSLPFAIGSVIAEQANVDPNTYILPGIAIASVTVGIILYLIVTMDQVDLPLPHLGDVIIISVILINLPLMAFGVSSRTILAYGSEFTRRSTYYALLYLLFLGLGVVVTALVDKRRSVSLRDMTPAVLGRKWYAVIYVAVSAILSIPFLIRQVEITQASTRIFYDSAVIGTAGLNGLTITIVFLYLLSGLTEIVRSIQPIHTVFILSIFSIVSLINFFGARSTITLYEYSTSDFAIRALIELLARINFIIGGYIGTKVVRANLSSD